MCNKIQMCSCLPVCQTYCTQTYVLAANSNQLTGIKNKQTKSDVMAIQTNNTENAYVSKKEIVINNMKKQTCLSK